MGLYTKQDEIINTIKVLRGEVEVLTKRTRERGTGYLYTALDVINKRIEELIDEVTAPYWKDEDGDIGRLPGQTKASHLRSVEDGFTEHTEAMELSRLKRIQNKAAGRPNMTQGDREKFDSQPDDSYEHTDEYYDRNRNREPQVQSMTSADNDTWGGLSNRSMKQRYGQAVQTTSEMMQEELEPLPINTFK